VNKIFGEDPIVAQKAMLSRVAKEIALSELGAAELANAGKRAEGFFGRMDLSSLWSRVNVARVAVHGAAVVGRVSSGNLFNRADTAQARLPGILEELATSQVQNLQESIMGSDGRVKVERVLAVLQGSLCRIVVRRHHGDFVRSALTQIAERKTSDLLLGITAQFVPGLRDATIVNMLGLHVEFAGEPGIDAGGVRRDFMDCFAATLTGREKSHGSRLALVEPLCLLGLGADCTWRPISCDEQNRGYLWALGKLLALALVYRCPCPVSLSLLVFKCLLAIPLRPGDVRQLDPDFWRHRVEPLLRPGGATARQAELHSWGMEPLRFMSADGNRELHPGGASQIVDEDNREEYAQLLCEDFLIGPIRSELGCLVTGFHEVVPALLLSNLDAEQLRMLVCGVDELDVDEWQLHAKVEGPEEVATWFFGWLRKQPQEARSKVLAFATGSSVLPCGWDGLKDQFGKALPFCISVTGNPDSLPSAHTCANLLVLPHVSTRAMLEQKLSQLIELAGREMLFR